MDASWQLRAAVRLLRERGLTRVADRGLAELLTELANQGQLP